MKSKPGDLLAWEVGKEGRVSVRRVQTMDVEYLRAVEKTMSEWNTAEDDVPISNLTAAGLPVASLVRFKLFTLDHRLIRGVLGHLSDQDAGRVTKSVRKLFI